MAEGKSAAGSAGCKTPGERTLARQGTVGGPPWPLPTGMIAAACVAHVVALVVLALSADNLARAAYAAPGILAAVHVYGLAFLTVTIVAAMLQLVPVILRQRVGSTVRQCGAGVALIVGASSLAAGLGQGVTALSAAGGVLLALGLLTVVVDLAAALWRAHRSPTGLGGTGRGLAMSGFWLAVVVGVGLVLAADRGDPFLGTAHTRVVEAHAAAALLGWIGGMIMAIALRLGPMFALSHGYRARDGAWALGAWHAGVVLTCAGVLVQVEAITYAGFVVLAGAALIAGSFLVSVGRHRRRSLEAPLMHLVAGVACAVAAACVALLAAFGVVGTARAGVVAVLLVLIGFGGGVTSGHVFKVVPMLVWTGRYAHLAGTPGAPRLTDMYPARLALVEAAAFALGLVLVVAGVASATSALILAGALALAAAALTVLVAVVICITVTPKVTAQAAHPHHVPHQGAHA